MREIRINRQHEEEYLNAIFLDSVDVNNVPIFVKHDNKLVGMLVNDKKVGETQNRWILRVGGVFGAYGYFATVKELMEAGERYEYKFFIN